MKTNYIIFISIGVICLLLFASYYGSVSIDDLDEQYGLTSDTIECLEEITDKDKILETLNIICENIKKLKEFSLKHNEELTKKDPDITPGVLQREKRRRLSLARPMYQDFDN